MISLPSLRETARSLYYRAYSQYHRPRKLQVPINKLLLGGDSGVPASKYARMINNYKRTSITVEQWPHVEFLRLYQDIGDRIFDRTALESTAYFRNAAQSIEYTGSYFAARSLDDLASICRSFIDRYTGNSNAMQKLDGLNGHSALGSSVRVGKLWESDCFVTIDGHHRIAIAHVSGDTHIDVLTSGAPQTTAAQDLLLDVRWQGGRPELYQPVDVPECASWPVLRKCEDRYSMMSDALHHVGIGHGATYLDVGASYGWFVRRAMDDGFIARGVERDPFAVAIGLRLLDLPQGTVTRADCTRYLLESKATIDVVSCFSVLHHFALGKGGISAEAMLSLLDRVTGRVLFIDTGQSHEQWFSKSLSKWTKQYVQMWLAENSKFSRIIPLGEDADNEGEFSDNYGRTLFACIR